MRFFYVYLLYLFIFVLTHVDFSMKNMELSLKKPFADDANVCLIDSATTHTILKNLTYFSYLKRQTASVSTICGNAKLIEGSGRAHIILPKGTKLVIEEVLYSKKPQRNLLSFKDIRKNGYHIETTNEGNVEYLCITTIVYGKKSVLERLPAFCYGLYYTNISSIEAHAIVNQQLTNHSEFIIWHNRLGHPGSIMMRKIIENSYGHSLKKKKILQANEFSCVACSQGKLIIRPSPAKIGIESPIFLECIHDDIFAYHVVQNVANENEDLEPMSMEECRHRED